MDIEYFDASQTPLRPGVNLIEASAGTGKTYAIAMLVLRFVVENAINIKDMLVVTFTKAATEELKDRIRSRLAEARRAVSGDTSVDPAILDWLAGLPESPDTIKQRLTLALLDIDQAGIFTIHGFCQNVLHDYALESGQLFDAELTGELASIKQACADDFWRQQMARPLWDVAVLTAQFKTPDALLASLSGFPGAGLSANSSIQIYPDNSDLDAVLAAFKQLAVQAQTRLDATASRVRQSFAEEKFKASYSDNFINHYETLSAWLQGHSFDIPDAQAFALLTGQGLLDALHGNKFRDTKTQKSAERKQDYLAILAIDTQIFDDLAAAYAQIPILFRRLLLEILRVELDKRLLQMNVMSFDDLINRLAEALQTEQGALLIAALREKYQAALIDEFQDTDDSQWLIFSSIFAAPPQDGAENRPFLYLIGDPKQAIYKFRGADIYSYLAAQKQAEYPYTLGKNWRSHPRLVAAVNTLFQREQAFLLEDVHFRAVGAGKADDCTALQRDDAAIAPMMLWHTPKSDSKSGYWTAGKAAQAIQYFVVQEVVDLLTANICFQPGNTPLVAKDIAILVRTNHQARDYQTVLRSVGVPSVINSTESVFASQEAADLYILLEAVANPGDTALLKQALALDWLGLDGQALYRLSDNEAELDQWLSRFAGYYQDWQTLGLMAMLMNVLERGQIRLHIAKTLMAERQLTNLHHLLELLQQAVLDEHLGIGKTLDWLRAAIAKAGGDENEQLRLESDEDAVKIVTMHRAKGLEYPVVFCPYLWQRSDRLYSEKNLLTCHLDGCVRVDLGSEVFEQHREQALYEELAEDLRVFYVAVTRAKYRCYLAWADVRSEAEPNESAMAWLLDFAAADFARQQAVLSGLANTAPDSFAYRLLDLADMQGITPLNPNMKTNVSLQARSLKRSLYTRWQMSSYTALSALSHTDTPELPQDKAREPAAGPAERSATELPRGAHTGNVVHDLLENNRYADLAKRVDISEQRDKACLRYGLKLPAPDLLEDLLQAVVSTPLSSDDPAFCLMNLPEAQTLKEMPFYLAMQDMDASHINRILDGSPAYQPLSSKQMCGFLTGFIDLICAYQGRFYVMDYKTNALPDYQPATLTEAMREHNYGLQYWLYTVVLHRYLQTRLPNYDFDQHVGGVRYLFVRGMQPEVAMSGVYDDKPDLPRVEALAALFGGQS
ncbi:MAG: exodeoxyribonuclease V subunit beta [Methylovulum sp.]|uniref:exodeoxyribonuclease V subunit beta n=1 Tax=Methylovulum sp. TaxID=1916980 RepID=UPI002614A5FC|nr:exodeoxyribonuclease V subunit beta [Methylovulum sp.]MDD2724316.1 exodeoxyribonuclease V subunit beta [Methylovulum sp.]MDD5124960.1 exodeoxyribonuclease V subunit beta [Methylovulum sp.]